MKESTKKCIEFLCTRRGKELYREELQRLKGTCSPSDPIWDRMPDFALQEVFNQFAPDLLISSDTALDMFGYATNRLDRDGDYIRWSTLPRIIAQTRKFDKLAAHLAPLLDSAEEY